MKQTPLILSIISIIAVIALAIVTFTRPAATRETPAAAADSSAVTAKSGDIVYIQLDRVVMEYDRYNDMRSAIESKAQGIQNDIQKRSKQFESDFNAFQNKMQKGLMTRSVAEVQQQELITKENELKQYVASKQAELQEEEFVMNNNIMNDIKTFLTELNKTRGYALILCNSEATNTVLVENPGLDISDEVIKGLNEQYIQTKSK